MGNKKEKKQIEKQYSQSQGGSHKMVEDKEKYEVGKKRKMKEKNDEKEKTKSEVDHKKIEKNTNEKDNNEDIDINGQNEENAESKQKDTKERNKKIIDEDVVMMEDEQQHLLWVQTRKKVTNKMKGTILEETMVQHKKEKITVSEDMTRGKDMNNEIHNKMEDMFGPNLMNEMKKNANDVVFKKNE